MSYLLGLRTVIYHVADIARAKEWYTRAVGAQPYFDESFYVGFNVGGFELGLDPDGEHSGGGNSGESGTVAYWGVRDVQQALNHLLEIGAELHESVKDVGGGIKVAAVRDLFGNVFGVIENPNFDIAECS